jgi:hypothetical protein
MRIIGGFVVAGVMVASSAARPCSIALPGMEEAVFPFEGRTVPRNVELRGSSFLESAVLFDSSVERFLSGPDDVRVEVELGNDDVGSLLIPAEPLVPGPWSLHFTVDPNLGTADRDVPFVVANDDDIDAPRAPVATASRRTEGTLVQMSSCDSSLYDVVDIVIDGDEDTVLGIVVDHGAVIGKAGQYVAAVSENAGGTVSYDVVVRDFAGNESPPTTVEVWAGCEGACSSSGGVLPLGVALLALTGRRRSRRPG